MPAATTFAELIEQYYREVVAQKSITDLSTVRGVDGTADGTTGEDEARTTAMCQNIARQIKAKLGALGASGDDAEQAAAIAVEILNLKYSGAIPLIVTPEKQAALKDLWQQIDDLAEALRQEASTPVVATDADGDGEVDEED